MLEGDEWRHAKEPQPSASAFRARLHDLNTAYALDKIERNEWSREFDKLCEPATELCAQR